MERTDTSNLETDGLRLDGVEDEEVVDRDVLLRQQLDRLLRRAPAEDARHRVQLASAVPAMIVSGSIPFPKQFVRIIVDVI